MWDGGLWNISYRVFFVAGAQNKYSWNQDKNEVSHINNTLVLLFHKNGLMMLFSHNHLLQERIP